jgi:exodeoxyribonuclease-3
VRIVLPMRRQRSLLRAHMKLVTWNVNSLKARLPRVLEFLGEHAPDVVCMQETKTEDTAFPTAELGAAGYHAVHHSAGRWAGVAIAARDGLALEDPVTGLPGELRDDEARWIEAAVGGIRVVSAYVPNGREVGSPTFEEKLAFLDAAAARVAALRAQGTALIVAGDFNVAPTDLDVYDPAAFVGSTHVTPEERGRVEALLGAGELVDAYRALHPDDVQYTWWDYRQVISSCSHTAVMPTNPTFNLYRGRVISYRPAVWVMPSGAWPSVPAGPCARHRTSVSGFRTEARRTRSSMEPVERSDRSRTGWSSAALVTTRRTRRRRTRCRCASGGTG